MNHPHKNTTHQTPKARQARNIVEVRKKRLELLDRALCSLFPDAHIALRYSTPWELLVAVILSAQCTDKKVNEVTATLFTTYKTFADYLAADPTVFAHHIRATGFFNSKARHILGAAKRIYEVYGGEVPRTMDEILTLPGVARKTANVVLGNAYGVVEGIAVDTHVKRFAIRFDLTDHTDPVHIEQDLMAIVPRKDWMSITYRIIEYGRQIAPARPYDTSKDPLLKIYPKAAHVFRV